MSEQDYKTVLWDIGEHNISDLPLSFVIQRVLSYGPLWLIVDTIKKNGLATVKKVFSEMKPSAVPAKKFNYLKNYLLE